MEALLRDLRFAFRNLLKHKGFTLAALLCLALGMGASSTIFSVVNALALMASYFPARRATKVDPLVALRYD